MTKSDKTKLQDLMHHLDALSVSWDNSAFDYADRPKRDLDMIGFCRGKAQGYAVAASKISEILDGVK